ncbi:MULTISPECIES: copper resistance system multicopper oxidase [Halomonadaceae]|uniref:Copper resistance system multicopper oxidase n=2 Tax=Halomonadaceae TaxID=28256 RepID=A0A9X4YCY8_9GAMM|nr:MULTISPECIES: copper resistance system multicopper oxidase [Halomonas]MYL27396.1 copper resistance system multicopper oxidase [Halomonas utahensis]MYL74522.1 copper resistance system multicopper oxidase [Halomonas sp. 22501_18_FS]
MSNHQKPRPLSRRDILRTGSTMGLMLGLGSLLPGYALGLTGNRELTRRTEGNSDIYELTIDRTPLTIDGRRSVQPITVNGSVPAPLIRLREGREAVLRVTNRLDEPTSIHWHGILLPFEMDGVPGVSFPGIAPGETFEYRYPVRQSGTYWYHSHSGLQEQLGHYGPLIVDPEEPEPFEYDREYAVVLSDWTFNDPSEVMRNLKVAEGYYNYNRRTVSDFFEDVATMGWSAAWEKAGMWGRMRMTPRDILDVTGAEYTYLMNGMSPDDNWTGLFEPGEKVRLRVINASAMSIFDVRIPGLPMTVVEADGQKVEPVETDEFRIGVAETYDVIIEPQDEAYTLFAQSQDRSGFTRGTLAVREGMTAPVPELYPRTERGMAAMGMADHGSDGAMDHGSMDGMMHGNGDQPPVADRQISHGPDNHGAGAAMVAMNPGPRLDDPGVGFEHVEHRVLTYDQLRGLHAWPDEREPQREVELHLTGNMERYMWSFDGEKFSEVDGPIPFGYGERLRLILVNDTMMDHPIHLHGMWMELETGNDGYRPRKHTLLVKPGEMISAQITPEHKGDWAFHCHLLYHMKAGMFRVVSVQ